MMADFDPSGWGWPQAAETEIRSHLHRLGPVLGELSFERVLMTQAQAEELGDRVALRPPNTAEARTLGYTPWNKCADFKIAATTAQKAAPHPTPMQEAHRKERSH